MRSRLTLFSLVMILVLLITACAPPMESAPTTSGDSAPAAADTGAVAVSTGDISRENTLIIGFEGGPHAAPEQSGLNPGATNSQGHH